MQHLAIIPDGNRRWAKKNKRKSLFGHKTGMEAFKKAIKVCIKNGIKYLSIYSFSLENFNRPEEEKNYLFNLMIEQAKEQLPGFIKEGVRVRFIGDKNFFPQKVLAAIKKMEEATRHLKNLNFNILFCYGGRREIVSAAKKLAEKVKAGILLPKDINEKEFGNSLWTSGMPEPDLIIRTSKRARLSNFLLYQAAYSELMFLDCFWPEITEECLELCLQNFKGIERNFGK